MELTPENKAKIDAKSYESLLCGIRFAPIGDLWFQGDTGKYWSERMKHLRSQPNGDAMHTAASKSIGW